MWDLITQSDKSAQKTWNIIMQNDKSALKMWNLIVQNGLEKSQNFIAQSNNTAPMTLISRKWTKSYK